MSRGRTVQRASTDNSVGDSSADERLTIMTRLAEDSGWIIWGGFVTFGRAWAWAIRSWTIWRAR
jgi:hypothetical protein